MQCVGMASPASQTEASPAQDPAVPSLGLTSILQTKMLQTYTSSNSHYYYMLIKLGIPKESTKHERGS